MKKSFSCFLFLLMLTVTIVNAQAKDEIDVAQAVKTLKRALISGNEQSLRAITADSLSYGHSSGKIEDKEAFVETLASGRSDFVRIDLTQQTIQITGNTAIVRHNLSAITNDNGKHGTVKLGIMLVWQKQQGKWKLLARQAYKI